MTYLFNNSLNKHVCIIKTTCISSFIFFTVMHGNYRYIINMNSELCTKILRIKCAHVKFFVLLKLPLKMDDTLLITFPKASSSLPVSTEFSSISMYWAWILIVCGFVWSSRFPRLNVSLPPHTAVLHRKKTILKTKWRSFGWKRVNSIICINSRIK